jgi:hypothetical protein
LSVAWNPADGLVAVEVVEIEVTRPARRGLK